MLIHSSKDTSTLLSGFYHWARTSHSTTMRQIIFLLAMLTFLFSQEWARARICAIHSVWQINDYIYIVSKKKLNEKRMHERKSNEMHRKMNWKCHSIWGCLWFNLNANRNWHIFVLVIFFLLVLNKQTDRHTPQSNPIIDEDNRVHLNRLSIWFIGAWL